MPTANINGTRLYYEVRGTGHPVVLLHGFGLDTRMWDDQFDAFAQRYHVIRYDLRGFGKSALPASENYSHANDLKALLDYLRIDHVVIVGLSRGGRWAIQFALEYKEETDALIVADAMPTGFKTQEERPSLSGEIISNARSKGIQAARASWFNHPIFERAKGRPDVSLRLWQMTSDYSGWHWLNEDPLINGHPPAAQRLREISAPTLVIVGEFDVGDFQRSADFLCQQIKNSYKVVIPGVGHMSNMEDPTSFNKAVLTFLDSMSVARLPHDKEH
jgi:3-oxoadipate enol-lactonase